MDQSQTKQEKKEELKKVELNISSTMAYFLACMFIRVKSRDEFNLSMHSFNESLSTLKGVMDEEMLMNFYLTKEATWILDPDEKSALDNYKEQLKKKQQQQQDQQQTTKEQ